MTDNEKNEILTELGEIRGEMRAGFKGTHNRLDITNGNVKENRHRINHLEEENTTTNEWRRNHSSQSKRKQAYIDWAVKGTLAVVGGIVLLAIISALQGVDLVSAIM